MPSIKNFSGRALARWATAAFLLAMILTLAQPLTALRAGADSGVAKLESLEIVTPTGPHAFLVEVMRTEAGRERGLMYRRAMAQDRGMLFDFGVEQPIQMWMKNTYLPLDMIFISRSGKVVGVAENAEPLSETIIPSGAPAYGVLELNAGAAAKIGVKIGDSVRHAMFAP
ncbi:protein of unknown function DUF192 [Methylocella silvestris BL2]|uniref:DUF192 domain-containing protein n=1 Tax=Methylocella silvestris (strain DSM 15510 / CIP 108128 / LMG 27833 / NCIMB 13906 / BL2) TaxID=395965 RepID=B8ELD3_METSB|nr:DUF192 domain-containing protein [Methylocella silvestris]ACK49522.1 protein of unknown function DUF192 [Methylocella silvestris BL2]